MFNFQNKTCTRAINITYRACWTEQKTGEEGTGTHIYGSVTILVTNSPLASETRQHKERQNSKVEIGGWTGAKDELN